MISAITKPIESIVVADLKELTDRKWPESENVEYKGELHREQGNRQDAWYAGGNLSEAAKRKLFKELVAFANTSGGRLFLGITETRDRPPCADAILPIPRCGELAERLEQSIISSIDPPLTFLRVIGVPTDGDSGVVIADVSASYNGPHRSPDLQCYVRKGTNSVPVGMREIHDIVMRLSRRQNEIERRLSDRRELFENWVGLKNQYGNPLTAFRVTAVPVGAPLYVEKVFGNREVSRNFLSAKGSWKQQGTQPFVRDFPCPCPSASERRILGGTSWASHPNDQRSGVKTIFRDGLVDIWFKWPWYKAQEWSGSRAVFPIGWLVASTTDALATVHAFKNVALSPNCEYGVQLEIAATNGEVESPIQLGDWGGSFPELYDAFETPALLGPYSLGESDAVVNTVVRDLFDASGNMSESPKVDVDWTSVWK